MIALRDRYLQCLNWTKRYDNRVVAERNRTLRHDCRRAADIGAPIIVPAQGGPPSDVRGEARRCDGSAKTRYCCLLALPMARDSERGCHIPLAPTAASRRLSVRGFERQVRRILVPRETRLWAS